MKVKPKEVLLNVPAVLTFDSEDEIPELAAGMNNLLHGKIKLKCETLGILAGRYVGIFYLQRNDEFSELRESFINMINLEEIS